ncbi:transcriptional regulator [Pandoraea morbifera]|uniref:Transcriptional regulator n=1 Tax=Pandoraea morbifera TaxID=2508300 RepID=A0A5E4R8T1_9BURK|nr:helix-turn-helix domain-containing protein [Pandoraea morbifera]VVD59756.1 transcriptional regulator [Pandoraea morbifera]
MADVQAMCAQQAGATPATPGVDPGVDPRPDSRPDSCADAHIDPLASAEADLARVLATLSQGRREGRESLSLARLAKRSALPMSTLLRYLGVLADAHWVVVEATGDTRQHVRLTHAGLAQHDSLVQDTPLRSPAPARTGFPS